MFKQIIGRLLQVVCWVLNHLEWITHPGQAADRVDPFVCWFLGHEKDDMDDEYCYRCRTSQSHKRHCLRCGEELK